MVGLMIYVVDVIRNCCFDDDVVDDDVVKMLWSSVCVCVYMIALEVLL